MLPLKWKFYKVLNYLLMVIAALIVLLIVSIILRERNKDDTPWQVFVVEAIFLIMVIKSIINVYIQVKKFPDKKLAGSQMTWHIIAVIMNLVTVIGLIIFLIGAAIDEFDTKDRPENNDGRIVLAIWILIWLIDCITLYFQFRVHSFLNKNNKALINSMIESIGQKS